VSFIKKSVPPPDVKEGEVVLAEILDVQFPVKGEYKEQVKWQVQFENGYETSVWTAYYEKPSDRSALGQLCITFMNLSDMTFETVSETLEAIKKHGKIYVKCSGFREWNDSLYPKFKVVPTKLPPFQKKINTPAETDTPKKPVQEDPEILKLTAKLKTMPEKERDEYIKKLAGLA